MIPTVAMAEMWSSAPLKDQLELMDAYYDAPEWMQWLFNAQSLMNAKQMKEFIGYVNKKNLSPNLPNLPI